MFPPSKPQHPLAHKRRSAKKSHVLTHLIIRALQVIFIIAGIVAIYFMIANNPKYNPLICDGQARPSMIQFGSCHVKDKD